MNDDSRRQAVAIAAGMTGFGAAAAFMIASIATMPPPIPPAQPGREPFGDAKDQIVMETCVILFAVSYTVGKLIYQWLDDEANLAMLSSWSRWHLLLLHALAATMLLADACHRAAGGQPIHATWPAFAFGGAFIILAVYDILPRRKRRTSLQRPGD